MHVHLPHQSRPIGADGLCAERQFARNLPNGLPRGEAAQDFVFAVRESLVGLSVNASLKVNRQLLCNLCIGSLPGYFRAPVGGAVGSLVREMRYNRP